MTKASITKSVAVATNEAEGSATLFSGMQDRFVRNGRGLMSQDYFSVILAKRKAIKAEEAAYLQMIRSR